MHSSIVNDHTNRKDHDGACPTVPLSQFAGRTILGCEGTYDNPTEDAMKTLTAMSLLSALILMVASVVMAADEPKATRAVCKADLKLWSAQNTEGLTINEIDVRMTEMVACANLTKKHEKEMWSYLNEFYRTHSELATRAFDFITNHDLQSQFGEEKNGAKSKKASEDSDADEDDQSKI